MISLDKVVKIGLQNLRRIFQRSMCLIYTYKYRHKRGRGDFWEEPHKKSQKSLFLGGGSIGNWWEDLLLIVTSIIFISFSSSLSSGPELLLPPVNLFLILEVLYALIPPSLVIGSLT